jgi:hypothetical protein
VLSTAKLSLRQRNTQKTKSKTKGEAPLECGVFLYAVVAKSKKLPRCRCCRTINNLAMWDRQLKNSEGVLDNLVFICILIALRKLLNRKGESTK